MNLETEKQFPGPKRKGCAEIAKRMSGENRDT
jgi:hypothetical protein